MAAAQQANADGFIRGFPEVLYMLLGNNYKLKWPGWSVDKIKPQQPVMNSFIVTRT